MGNLLFIDWWKMPEVEPRQTAGFVIPEPVGSYVVKMRHGNDWKRVPPPHTFSTWDRANSRMKELECLKGWEFDMEITQLRSMA